MESTFFLSEQTFKILKQMAILEGVKRMNFTPKRPIAFKRTCEINPACENDSFIFTIDVKSVPLYHFLAYVVLHVAVKEVLETHFLKMEK